MNTKIITLCYRKIFDVNSTKAWDKMVFEDSYMEFRLQAQNFSTGTSFTSYADLSRNIPDAQQLQGRILPSITGYLQQLNNIVPDIVNNLGRRFLKFYKFKFELINSDINDKNKHQIGINFYSESLHWHETIENFLLVSAIEEEHGVNENKNEKNEVFTNLFQLQPYLSIYSMKNIL